MQSDRIDSLAVNFWRTTLKIFNAADFGIVPNEDISEKLAEFISVLKAEDGEKTAVFDSGTYYIDSKRRKKLRQKKTALGHAEDDHEDWNMEQRL